MKFAVIASLMLSILCVALFYGKNLGISVLLFVLVLLAITICVLNKHKKVKNKVGYLLTIPIVLLSSTYAIYQNAFFQVTNILVMIILYNVMLIWLLTPKYQLEFLLKRIFHLIIKPFTYIKQTCNGFGKVFQVTQKKEKSKKAKSIEQIAIGITVALPILIIVIALLCSADNEFANQMGSIFGDLFKNAVLLLRNQKCFDIIAKIIITCALTIYFISFIINIVSRSPYKKGQEKGFNIQIETTILNTVVTILNIIYFLFCKIQITNLFAKIATNEGIDYANYAREGFFQLMAVSIINFAMIIITTKNTKQSSNMQIYYRKAMNLILAVANTIILISAFIRMNLYGQEYGYTFLRLLVYFALITEGLLTLPTLVYIISNKFSPWKSYFVIVTVMYVIMNFSNINKIIATQNVNKYLNDGKEIDVSYLTKTKTDGLEQVIELYKKIDDEYLKGRIERYFANLKLQLQEENNIIEWNYSKWKAKTLLKQF